MSFEADLNVLALSDIRVDGSPLLLVNPRNAIKKASVLSQLVSSKWTALVEAHVNRQTYALEISAFAPLSFVYKGTAKSTPVCVKGGSSETRSSGSSGGWGRENGCPSTLLHLTHFLRTLLTLCLPQIIQKRSRSTLYSLRCVTCGREFF